MKTFGLRCPYQIKRLAGSEPRTYEFHPIHVPTGELICGDAAALANCASYLRDRQAQLNTKALLDTML